MPNLYKTILQQCSQQCELLIVSKHRSVEQIQAYYDQGARNFGENRVQELLQKAPQLPQDIRWNFIGHLQRNKVRAVMPYISRLCSLDSLALAAVAEKEAARLTGRWVFWSNLIWRKNPAKPVWQNRKPRLFSRLCSNMSI